MSDNNAKMLPQTGKAGALTAPLVPLIAGLVVWELAGWAADFRFLPPFSRVLSTALGLIADGQIVTPLLASLLNLLAGYGAAVALGLAVGVLMGRYPTIEFILGPYLNAFLAAPKVAFVPVFFALFGLSRLIQVAVIFLSAFFVIVLNTMRSIQTVNPEYVEMARALGATERQLLRKVLLPGALPLAMAGLRLAIGHAVRAMITAEMLVALFGLGALLRAYGDRFDAERVLGVLLIVIVVGLVCTETVRFVERHMTAWADTQA